MPTRIVEGKLPYTGGDAITVDENKVISLNLRDENNLIIYDAQDDEIYVDLQLPDGIKPTDAFPVGVTTGRVLVADGWDKAGTIISAKTTSGDVIKLLYADEGTLWIDNGTGTFKQIYFKADVDAIIATLTAYINAELAKKQNGVVSATAPSNPIQGDLWYDTTSNSMKVYDGTNWNAVGTGGGSDIEYVTQAEYNALLPGALTDNKHYFIYSTDGGGGWQPGANTVAYYTFNNQDANEITDSSGNNRDLTGGSMPSYSLVSGTDYAGNYASGSGVAPSCSFGGINDNPYTILMRVKPTANSQAYVSVFEGPQMAIIRGYNSGEFEYYDSGGGGRTAIKSGASLDTWYLIGYTKNGSSIATYCNGVAGNTTTGNISTGSKTLFLGSSSTGDRFSGLIGECIVEDKVWTAQEISDYYDQTKGDYGIS